MLTQYFFLTWKLFFSALGRLRSVRCSAQGCRPGDIGADRPHQEIGRSLSQQTGTGQNSRW